MTKKSLSKLCAFLLICLLCASPSALFAYWEEDPTDEDPCSYCGSDGCGGSCYYEDNLCHYCGVYNCNASCIECKECGELWCYESCVPSITINPNTATTITIGESIKYSSIATKRSRGGRLVRHDFDWRLLDGGWVSELPNSSGPGTVELGALTGTAPRTLALSMAYGSERMITMTPTQPGSYRVRFSVMDEYSSRENSPAHILTVNNVLPIISIDLPETIHTGQTLPLQFIISNPTGLDHYLISYQIEEKRTAADGTAYQNWTTIASQTELSGMQMHAWSGTANPVTQKGTIHYRVRTGNQWASITSDIGQIFSVDIIDLKDFGLQSVIASSIANNWAIITWSGNVNVAKYQLLINGVVIGSTNTNTFTITGLKPATPHIVTVRAMDAAGNILHPGIPCSFTTRLDNPVISDIVASGVTLTWQGSTSAGITYEIERSTDGVNFYKIAEVSDALIYTDTDLDPGVTYYYRMRTNSDNGSSGYTSTVTGATQPPPPPSDTGAPPQTGMRLWLKADAGVEFDNSGRVKRWRDQSTSQAHAVLPQGGIGPQSSNSSDLGSGFTTIVFNGQTNALELPFFMDNATAATAYVIVKSEKANNPLWSMGGTSARTLYPGESGRIEDGFASTTVQVTRASTPPLHEWHAYQVTSASGVWWPALDQVLLPVKKNMAVDSLMWSDAGPLSAMSALSVSYIVESDTNALLPALLPENGYLFDATVQAENPSLSNNYFGLQYIGLKLEDGGVWLECFPSEGYVKTTPFVNGTARLTLAMDEVENFLGVSLPDKRITGIHLEFEAVLLDANGVTAGNSNFFNNYDIKANFAIVGTEVKNQFNFAALPEIGGGFKGEIAEILIYDQTAPADESVNNYLSSKYRIFFAELYKDSDGDGIPDMWEIVNGLDPLDLSDALTAADADGATWLQKYQNSLPPKPTGPLPLLLLIRTVDETFSKIETNTWKITPFANP